MFHPLLIAGMQSGTATLGDSLAVSYKTRHRLTVRSTVLCGIYPNELKTCLHQNLPINIYNSFIYNRLKLEATEVNG